MKEEGEGVVWRADPLSWRARVLAVCGVVAQSCFIGFMFSRSPRAGFMHWFFMALGGVVGACWGLAIWFLILYERDKRYFWQRAVDILVKSPHNGGRGL